MAATPVYAVTKRVFDVGSAAMALMIVAIPLLLVACAVRLRLGSPVLFTQERAGRHGRPFRILKFRTMTDARDRDGTLLPDGKRLTPFGAFLRSTSIDELPSLINILAGDLSVVGPRPLFMRYNDRYTVRQARRLEVRPGLTGWAQAQGRNALSWDRKFELDLWYVDNRSWRVDLRIIVMTAWQVLTRRGIAAAGSATMPEFMGAASAAAGEGGARE